MDIGGHPRSWPALTHNPPVAGSTPARPTAFLQFTGLQMISDRGITAPNQDHAHRMLRLDRHRRRPHGVSLGRNRATRRGIWPRSTSCCGNGHVVCVHAASPRRRLPPGIRGRGSVFTYTWRDHAGRQFSRKAGDTLEQVEAFKRRIDDQLALGEYRPASTTTFAAYAGAWIEVAPLKEQTRYRYRGILRRELLPVFGPLQLARIHPHLVRIWVAGPLSASSVRQHIAVLRSCLKAAQIDGHLETLPLLGVKMPRSHSRQLTVLTLGEAFAMIEAAPADWQCAIATALFTGLRLGCR